MKTARSKAEIVIFLDIDGVIADFEGHARAHGKMDPKGTPLWNALDETWWATMPAYAGAREFYNALKKCAPVNFLTAPTMSTDCFSGKSKWVQGFVPERGIFILEDLIICPAIHKHRLATPKTILVDDRIKNVEEWRAAGGIAIHHQGDYAVTLAAVTAAVQKLKAQASKPPAPGR